MTDEQLKRLREFMEAQEINRKERENSPEAVAAREYKEAMERYRQRFKKNDITTCPGFRTAKEWTEIIETCLELNKPYRELLGRPFDPDIQI